MPILASLYVVLIVVTAIGYYRGWFGAYTPPGKDNGDSPSPVGGSKPLDHAKSARSKPSQLSRPRSS